MSKRCCEVCGQRVHRREARFCSQRCHGRSMAGQQRQPAPSYSGAHMRVRAVRGHASDHVCGCGSQAAHWAYLHNDPAALVGRRGESYSADPNNYVPMCVPCHKAFDLARLAEGAAR